jgi:hypothetical protein
MGGLVGITGPGRRGNGVFTLRRSAPPALNGRGVWQPGAITEEPLAAAIWPADGRQILPLPEGVRIDQVIEVHTELELRCEPGQEDRVIYRGAPHRVFWTTEFLDAQGNHLWVSRAARELVP